MAETFDYIVIGAGSAGCIVANRLSASGGHSVLLLEAGPKDDSLYLRMPAAFSLTAKRQKFDWGYVTEPEPAVLNRRFLCPRGRVLGGSSSINAMCFVRGHRQDFDDWAADGLAEWSYAHCLSYFKKMETFSGGDSDHRGADGPLNITAPRYSNPLNSVFVSAAEQAGFQKLRDTNGAEQEGFGPVDQTIHQGRRVSAASAYLAPAFGRKNLEVRTDVLVSRILFEDLKATGVLCQRGGQEVTLQARREVIVCAGAINSPKLLMFSGIGPGHHLRETGLQVTVDRAEVGANLQDHLDVSVKVECLQPVSAVPLLRQPRKTLVGLQWLLFKTGAAATNHFETAGYIRTAQDLRQPNIQVLFIPLLVSADGKPLPHKHGYQATVMPLRPKSRGTLSLQDANPATPPSLKFNYMEAPGDLDEMREGVKCLRRIFAQPAFSDYRGAEVGPGDHVSTDEALDAYILEHLKSNYHPCGTCRMGSDAASVVDPAGRVRGTRSLRVVDSSIFPSITSGNINAPTMMVAEKLSDAILGS